MPQPRSGLKTCVDLFNQNVATAQNINGKSLTISQDLSENYQALLMSFNQRICESYAFSYRGFTLFNHTILLILLLLRLLLLLLHEIDNTSQLESGKAFLRGHKSFRKLRNTVALNSKIQQKSPDNLRYMNITERAASWDRAKVSLGTGLIGPSSHPVIESSSHRVIESSSLTSSRQKR